MLNQKETRKRNLSKYFYVVAILIIAFFTVSASKEFLRSYQVDKEISDLQSEIDRLKIGKEDFLTSLEKYNSESFIEQQARTQFSLKKNGEKVVVINNAEPLPVINPDAKSSSLPNSDQYVAVNDQNSKASSNVKLWWQYFFNNNN